MYQTYIFGGEKHLCSLYKWIYNDIHCFYMFTSIVRGDHKTLDFQSMDWFNGNSTHWFSHEKYGIRIGFRTSTAMTAMGAQPLKFPEPCHFHRFKELPFGNQTLPMGIPNINGALVYENHWYLIHSVPAKLHHTESPRMLKSSNPSATFKWHKKWPCFLETEEDDQDDQAILGCLPDVKTHFWDPSVSPWP